MDRWARAMYQPVLPIGKDGSRITACREHILLAKEAAKEGMVLVKNQGHVLPLKKGSRVALFGKGTFDYVKGGGGSGDVTVAYTRSLYDGFQELKDEVSVFEELADFYREDVKKQRAEGRMPGMTVEPQVPEELLRKARVFADTAVISICRFSGEGWDRTGSTEKVLNSVTNMDGGMAGQADQIFEDGDFYLSHGEATLIEAVKTAFDKVIVVLNVGGMVATGWFKDDDHIQSVLIAWQGGIEGGLAAAELMMGHGNPCGKLADTFADKLEDYPSTATFHESDQYVDYIEDIYVGYRYFETVPWASAKVNYPFGFGLSYTTFSLSMPTVERQDDTLRISVNVCNTGNTAGKEVVQVYYSAPQGKLGKPARELAAFRKTGLLKPGETQTVILHFSITDMASYDDLGKVAKSAYVLEKGEYRFYVGTSVRDTVEADFVLTMDEDRIVKQLTQKLVPVQLKKRMLSDGSFEELPQGEPVDTDANVLERHSQNEFDGLLPVAGPQERGRIGRPQEGIRYLWEVAEGELSVEEFLAQFSDEELARLLGGQPNMGVANTFGYGNQPKYGVPNIMTADGPAGLRINPQCGVCTTAWPCATLLACTWNPDIAEAVGAAGGAEVKENNIGVWLTPAVNIHRSPLCGRNFEYYSEDPYLTGKMAAAMVTGIQSNHVAATVKHFALNNKETNRINSDSRASERSIREI